MPKYKDEDLVRLFMKGMTYAEMAGELRASAGSLSSRVCWLRQKGVNLPPKPPAGFDADALNALIDAGKK